MIRQAFGEERMEKSKLIETEKARQLKSRFKSIFIILFDMKRTVYKEFFQAVQSINSAYYCDIYSNCVKLCEDFAPNFGDKITDYCITKTHHLTLPLSPGNFFTKNNMTVVPHKPYSPDLAPCDFSLFLAILTQFR
jgi:hypothetical protein